MAKNENTTPDALIEVANNLYEIATAINRPNDHGSSIGDELHDIAFSFSRIADALEKMADK